MLKLLVLVGLVAGNAVAYDNCAWMRDGFEKQECYRLAAQLNDTTQQVNQNSRDMRQEIQNDDSDRKTTIVVDDLKRQLQIIDQR